MVGRHPARTVGLAVGAAFFFLGGPSKTVHAVRRAFGAAADGEKAYAALPASLRSFVDASATGFGESKAEAKGQMALALLAWRADPKNRKRADRLISETLTPPGPQRAFWALVEVAAVTAAGIIAKQVVARSMAGGAVRALLGRPGPVVPPISPPAAEAAVDAHAAADTKAPSAKSKTAPGPSGYTGWSGRSEVAGPAREPAPSKTTR
jgi:hypothetical protein